MKNIAALFFSSLLLLGCLQSSPSSTPTATLEASALPSLAPNSVSSNCVAKSNKYCCEEDVCAAIRVSCLQGFNPVFKGCDSECIPVIDCVPSPTPVVEEVAASECIFLCEQAVAEGRELSNGPCLSDDANFAEGWVCDVAHEPRQDVDNQEENQCSVFREGKASKFVEVSEVCELIKVFAG